MEITVQYTGQLAGITGAREEVIELSPGTPFSDLVSQLSAKHGRKYSDLILTYSGELRPSTLIVSSVQGTRVEATTSWTG